jgi:parvulin-like peptidyl-prolyl isomerase
LLDRSGLSRREYEELVAAGILGDRLLETFKEEAGDSGAQLLVSVIRFANGETAAMVRERAAAGEDFDALVEEFSLDVPEGESAPEAEWVALAALPQVRRAALADLAAGAISEVVSDAPSFYIYRVADRADDREYSDDQLSAIGQRRLEEWLEEQAAFVPVEDGMSQGEREWIIDRIVGDGLIRDFFGA